MIKRVVAVALASLVVYFGFFALDQHFRTRHGPWSMQFGNNASGELQLVVSQPGLGLKDIRILFEGERTNIASANVRFETPDTALPIGELLFLDTTYQPGTATLNVLGHGIELAPRVLRVNNREIPWQNEAVVRLISSEKTNPSKPKRKR